MRISTRIRLNIVFLLGIGLFIVAVLGSGLLQVRALVEYNDEVARTLNGMFELSILTTDYLANQEARSVRQWRDKHASLEKDFDDIVALAPDSPFLLGQIREEHERAGVLFEQFVAADETEAHVSASRSGSALYSDRLVARLLISLQTMVSDTIELGEQASARIVTSTATVTWSVLGLSGIAVLLSFVFAFSTEQAIVRPIRQLKASAGKVGAGNFIHRTGLATRRDEIGDLAGSFDDMVGDLARSYAMLETEIVDHRRTQNELDRHKDQLEDLVEQRTAELADALASLEAATEAKDRFLAAMSHELRTPLNSIIGFTDIILRGHAGLITEEQRRQLSMVHRSGKQLLELVNDVLDLSRIEAGHVSVHAEEFAIEPLARSLIESLTPIAEQKNLVMSLVVDESTPQTVYSDPGKVQQILLNLLSNALKFTEQGSVTMELAGGRDSVRIAVRDTGMGVPRRDYDKIFDRFHQVDTPRLGKAPGTGLGLAICRNLASVLGGTITLESEEGVGSVFALTLPLRYENVDDVIERGL